ncbi:MAG: CGGC domain-containing protein [Clostridia bacterium]|nr:CGGC domain-containing protein [Clostridia bacterium]
MKVGIIRCMQTEDICPGTDDFLAVKNHTGAFADIKEDIDLVGFCNCGGCPGNRVVLRAKKLAEQGAQIIAFSTCIQKGRDICFPCPYAQKMKDSIIQALGDQVTLLNSSHD